MLKYLSKYLLYYWQVLLTYLIILQKFNGFNVTRPECDSYFRGGQHTIVGPVHLLGLEGYQPQKYHWTGVSKSWFQHITGQSEF